MAGSLVANVFCLSLGGWRKHSPPSNKQLDNIQYGNLSSKIKWDLRTIHIQYDVLSGRYYL